jgi:hypothetical protein
MAKSKRSAKTIGTLLFEDVKEFTPDNIPTQKTGIGFK